MIRAALLIAFLATFAAGQTYIQDSKRESARSDKLTNGIKKAAFIPGDPNIRLTLEHPFVPADDVAKRKGSGDVSCRRRQDRFSRAGQPS